VFLRLPVSAIPFLSFCCPDPDEEVIGPEGIMKLCEDLEIEPADIAVVRL